MHCISLPTFFFTFLVLSLTTPLNLFSIPSSKSSLANAQSTSSRNMTLYRDDLGFYIYAYNDPNSSDNSDNTPSSNGIPMMLGLYTSKTSLMTNCLNFSSYNCSSQICDSIPNSQGRQNYLSFQAKGYETSAILYLDYNYWSLNGFALLATSCKSNTSVTFGSSRYGIIGMGVQSQGIFNYAYHVVFGISIAPDLWSGQLTFLNSSTQINHELATHPLLTDANWNIPHYVSVIRIGKFNLTTTWTFNVFFDLGADTIGIAQSLFESLMTHFREEVFRNCTHVFIRPQCTYNGLIDDLPDITILMANSTIVIPPAIYIQNASNITGIADLVTLNFRAIGPDLTGDSYVVDNPYYKSAMILDIHFMSYYYVVFNSTDTGRIYIYHNKEKQNTDPTDDNNYAVYILFGCIGFIVLMAVVYSVFRCYQKKKYLRVFQTNIHETLIHRDLQSESSVRHVDESEIERGE